MSSLESHEEAAWFVDLVTSSLERQHWLELAVEALRLRFDEAGYLVPQKVRVSIGFPKRAASCGAIGECWSTKASSDASTRKYSFRPS